MSRRGPLIGTLVAVVAAVSVVMSAVVGGTLAAFSATTANSANSFSAASSFCTSPGTQTVATDADSYVDEDQPGTNRGYQTSLETQSRQGGRNRRVLVHFPLPAAQSCTVGSATLRLYATNAAGGRTLQAYQAGGPWSEGAVTWANQPPSTGAPSMAPSGTGWVQFDVTAQVQAMYAGGNEGFLVRDSVESQNPPRRQVYDSKESSGSPPELLITFA